MNVGAPSLNLENLFLKMERQSLNRGGSSWELELLSWNLAVSFLNLEMGRAGYQYEKAGFGKIRGGFWGVGLK